MPTAQATLPNFWEGFVHDPLTIIISLLVVLLIVGGLTIVFVLQGKRRNEEKKKESMRLFRKSIEEKKLDPEEVKTLLALSHHLAQRDSRIHLLLSDENLFAACEKRMLGADPDSYLRLNPLRFKLGFSQIKAGKQMFDTASLAAGMQVFVEEEKVRAFFGSIVRNTADGIEIEVEEGTIPPAPQTPLRITFQREEGTYIFRSRSTELAGRLFRIAHSTSIERNQKRNYHRKKTSVLVRIRKAGTDVPYEQATLFEIGGGGCTLENPAEKYKIDDHMEIVVVTEKKRMRVFGDVLRFSGGDKSRMHLVFHSLEAAQRDDLIGFIQTYL